MNHRPLHRPACARPAFSLVEVLIAILVLAIGLLGLAAVFPAVIAQQREAADVTSAGTLADQAAARILIDSEALRLADLVRAVPAALRDEPVWSDRWTADNAYAQTGRCTAAGSAGVNLPAAARLIPAPGGRVQPQYVWDCVALSRPGEPARCAVFVRRIDTGIRVPRGATLSDGLLGTVPGQTRPALPVSVDADGRPGNRGEGFYAVPRIERVRLRTSPDVTGGRISPASWLVLGANADLAVTDALSRPGQKVVGEDGIVRTVVGEDDTLDNAPTNEVWIKVEPPFPAEDDDHRVAFTPQVPVAVTVVTLPE